MTRSRNLATYAVATLVIIANEMFPLADVIFFFCAAVALIGCLTCKFGLTRPPVIIANAVTLSLLITPLSKIFSADASRPNGC